MHGILISGPVYAQRRGVGKLTLLVWSDVRHRAKGERERERERKGKKGRQTGGQ